MKVDALLETIDQLVRPIAEELNYEIYHIEYVKENGEYYLRIYIDKDGGIALSDCEALSRRVSDVMDEKDPIKEAYFLEVSSPGLNRTLFTDDHFKKQIGKEIMVRFTKSLNGRKNIKGILKEVNDDSVIVETDDLITIPKDKIKSANLEGEI
ncbi:ribosome maturation factor RimP [Clostridium tertium]|jgi:ribosome maturation factor RimP|uniref:Ribosome maturation factor RimP n=1 Tax=Clostridium tertium TaxID=1559 RepID=A0A9X3XH21_9CLOT|nr:MULTISPECIES: ribosome maturation factor RimP [Clostridium]MBP1867012.1 ribosome maturation factor RimP [Clostridium tertium]MBS5883461.1 ribosome maturation factor RimP [Clostridium sp.]MBU6135682.1 ribosome maturation factor RimP [Clostridium tertium]MDB1939922.1 ribosome maturation factor RimP [Clostridium tertium]MDB1953876.1 ribosome maturation factor RimP [Clostridium tertium]